MYSLSDRSTNTPIHANACCSTPLGLTVCVHVHSLFYTNSYNLNILELNYFWVLFISFWKPSRQMAIHSFLEGPARGTHYSPRWSQPVRHLRWSGSMFSYLAPPWVCPLLQNLGETPPSLHASWELAVGSPSTPLSVEMPRPQDCSWVTARLRCSSRPG